MEASFHNIVSWDCRYTRMTFSQKYECKAVIQMEEVTIDLKRERENQS